MRQAHLLSSGRKQLCVAFTVQAGMIAIADALFHGTRCYAAPRHNLAAHKRKWKNIKHFNKHILNYHLKKQNENWTLIGNNSYHSFNEFHCFTPHLP